jgi:hypothetical protein
MVAAWFPGHDAGQSAGVAAAVSVKGGRSFQATDITLLQAGLRRQEVRIG